MKSYNIDINIDKDKDISIDTDIDIVYNIIAPVTLVAHILTANLESNLK